MGETGFDQGTLDLGSGDVSGVEDAALVVPPLPSEVEFVLMLGVAEFAAGGEPGAEFDQVPDGVRTGFDDFADHVFFAELDARGQRVADMFIKRVGVIPDAGDAALRQFRVAVIDFRFGDDDHFLAGPCQVQRGGQSCQSAADDDMPDFTYLADFHISPINCI